MNRMAVKKKRKKESGAEEKKKDTGAEDKKPKVMKLKMRRS